MKTLKSLTRNQIKNTLGCPGYIIDYLYDCGRLPVVKQSKGRGYPILYDPEAIDIVKKHLNKSL